MGNTIERAMFSIGLLAVTVLAVAVAGGGCGGSDSPTEAGGLGAPVADTLDVAPTADDAAAATDATAAVPQLTLALDASLDTSPGTVKATALTQAQLLNTAKAVVATATISAGTARFPLTGLTAGHYFIKVNGLSNNLVPTKIDNPTASRKQWVGRRLRSSVIGSLTSPTYRIEMFPGNQGFPRVVKYSDGTTATPQGWAYVIMRPGSQTLETRYLGTAVLLTSHAHSGPHSFSSWMLGPSNHGKSSLNCASCHGSSSLHPASYGSIKEDVGWCYKCHYGPTGPTKGMVKPTQ
ncbi:MAG: hypothetical protein FJX74_07545 [Armatimonadetes bacterium]|nr:hypothetical protein [Armatimonadota bacterium]